MEDDPAYTLSSPDIVFLNSKKNPLEYLNQEETKKTDFSLYDQWKSQNYYFKVVRLDLYDNESLLFDQDYSNRSANITKVYKRAYKMLKKDLIKNKFSPCVVSNLQHQVILTKDTGIIYIFF